MRMKLYLKAADRPAMPALANMAHYSITMFDVEKILKLRWNSASMQHEVCVHWKSFSQKESTWHPLSLIYMKDITTTMNFINTFPEEQRRACMQEVVLRKRT